MLQFVARIRLFVIAPEPTKITSFKFVDFPNYRFAAPRPLTKYVSQSHSTIYALDISRSSFPKQWISHIVGLYEGIRELSFVSWSLHIHRTYYLKLFSSLRWYSPFSLNSPFHYIDIIMGSMASQITNLTIVYWTVYSGADQSKHQSSASLAFVRGIHRRPVNSPHKWPITRKMFPFDDVIMSYCYSVQQ